MTVSEASPVAVAQRRARDVARQSGVEVRELTDPADFIAAERLLAQVWSTGLGHTPLPRELLCALSFSGAYTAGAYHGERLVGVAAGFLADDRPHGGAVHLHSHITGVVPIVRSRQVGFALKLHQGAWALGRGIELISWTFDPLVSRNAHFNLHKLRAGARRYLVDFYGEMSDQVNSGWGSDRLLAEWRPAEIRTPQHLDIGNGVPVAVVLDRGAHEEPRPRWSDDASLIACRLPQDIEHLRRIDAELAVRWRYAVRQTLQRALAENFQIIDYDRSHGYLLRKLLAGTGGAAPEPALSDN
ncbi:GNAT family N-acetyltransferase [Nonomuraea zeae]|uniref:GNAT family N-acetyltransferase n=1 Tax=Nonomuraea zeae TaxID=1642303 RepID=A0A5S4G439_9ACTN|nr:GNAT family N-acetyltransferase [Nonomuraea zeae]TMR27775.1 GNAT family N-acetyltransferase [Nonomuraea zeae]